MDLSEFALGLEEDLKLEGYEVMVAAKLAISASSGPWDGRRESIMTVATAGGEPREICQPKMPVSVILWGRDGRNLIWSSRQQGAEQKVEILTMPAEGGEPQSYGIAQRNVLVTTISPDGRQIVFQGFYTESVVWIMKLLGSKAKSSRQGVLENTRFPISAAEEAITKIEKMTIMSPAFCLMIGKGTCQAAAGAVGILASSSASRCSACTDHRPAAFVATGRVRCRKTCRGARPFPASPLRCLQEFDGGSGARPATFAPPRPQIPSGMEARLPSVVRPDASAFCADACAPYAHGS